MKIALNAMQVRAAKSGVGQYIEGLLDGLLELLNDSDQQPIDPVNHADSLSVCMYCSADNVANYARTATFPYETRVWGLPQRHRALRLLNEHLRLASEVRREGFDVFHGLSNFLPLGLRCPSVVTIHDLSYYVEPERCPFVRRQYWYAMTAHAVRTATRIITPSQNTRRDIERFFPDYASKVRVVPSGVHRRFQPNAPSDSQTVKTQSCHGLAPDGHTLPYFLSVCTLEPGKNLGLAVSAFEAVAKRNDEVRLALAGDRGWNYEPLIRQIGESPVRDRILLLGHVPDQDVVELMRGCSAFLYPSRYEGFGMPPLEALACGAPVISSTGGSLSEVLAGLPGVTPLPHDDLPGWTRAMAFSLERGAPSLEDRMRWATEVRRKYDWRVAASLTFDVWHDALNAG